MDGLAGTEQELGETLVSYGMEISAEKTKLMPMNNMTITVQQSKNFGAIIIDERLKPKILTQAMQTNQCWSN